MALKVEVKSREYPVDIRGFSPFGLKMRFDIDRAVLSEINVTSDEDIDFFNYKNQVLKSIEQQDIPDEEKLDMVKKLDSGFMEIAGRVNDDSKAIIEKYKARMTKIVKSLEPILAHIAEEATEELEELLIAEGKKFIEDFS